MKGKLIDTYYSLPLTLDTFAGYMYIILSITQ